MHYSQFGEDRILAEIFHEKTRGNCVEVGANDGYHGSTSLYFEKQGWDCILIEPNPLLAAKLRAERSGQVFECAASDAEGTATLQLAEGAELAHALSSISNDAATKRIVRRHGYATRPVQVATRPLDAVLEEAGVTHIDFITIDVEGHELSTLRGFSLQRWRPTIVIVEDNGLFGDKPVQRHLKSHGFVRFHRTGVNDWYTHRSNEALAMRARGWSYIRALIRGRVFLIRHASAQQAKKIPGVERLYRGFQRLSK
jgi:FkbM family methyltransferase